MGTDALSKTSPRARLGAAPQGSRRRPRAAAVRRQHGAALGAPQPDQALGRLPESGVLQEADDATLDGDHSARDRLRRGIPAAHRTTTWGLKRSLDSLG